MSRFVVALFGLIILAACSSPPRHEPSIAERRGNVHSRQGVAAEEEGDLSVAADEFRRAYRAYAAIDAYDGAATALINLSRIERRLGRAAEAAVASEHALKILPVDSSLRHEAIFESALSGRYDSALKLAREGLHLAPPSAKGRHRNLLARLLFEGGDAKGAESAAATALEENRASSDLREEANSLRLLGEISRSAGDFLSAEAHFQKVLQLDKELGMSSRIGDDLLVLGDLSRARNRDDLALDYWRRAWEVRINAGDADGAALALDRAVVWLQSRGRHREAEELRARGSRPSVAPE